jgi:alpha-D-ribose 1-methylphosphonate 5-triphosphate synthase subunit PhnH
VSAVADRTRIGALTGVESQAIFSQLLNALARPGAVGVLERPVGLEALPPELFVPLALAGVDVSIAALLEPESPDWFGPLIHATGAHDARPEEADIVLALRPPTPDELRSFRRGTARSPERGAMLALGCAGLTAGGDAAVRLALSGPGIPGEVKLGVRGIPVEVFETLVTVNRKFPMGIDTFLAGPEGSLAGLPRTTQIRIEEGQGSWATQR